MSALTPDQILEKLTGVFREVFDDDDLVLTPATTAEDIEEWDSLNQIKLIIGCEKAFGVKLKARDVNATANVGEMVEYLQSVIAG